MTGAPRKKHLLRRKILQDFDVAQKKAAARLAEEDANKAAALMEAKREAKRARKLDKRRRDEETRERETQQSREARREAHSRGSSKRFKYNRQEKQNAQNTSNELEVERAKVHALQLASLMKKAEQDADLQAERQQTAVMRERHEREREKVRALEDEKIYHQAEMTKRSTGEYLKELLEIGK